MKRTIYLSAASLVAWLGIVSTSSAQVWVRAPFVRVGVGDGVYVRAPFVNLWIPGGATYSPIYGPLYGPPLVAPPATAPTMPPASEGLAAPKQIAPLDNVPPLPIQPVSVPTLDGFAKTFQPKAGSYDVTMINPTTNQPTQVRFTLPEGSPRRVIVNRNSIEFVYALRTWVRIEFDRDGAMVTAR
jgi:hypothetical protein